MTKYNDVVTLMKACPNAYLGQTKSGDDIIIFCVDEVTSYVGLIDKSSSKPILMITDKKCEGVLQEVNHAVLDTTVSVVETVSSLPSIEIISDYNEVMSSKGYKVLAESKVKAICDSLGIVYSATYTSVKATIPTRTYRKLPRGYSNYAKEFLAVSIKPDSKFDSYLIDGRIAEGLSKLDRGANVYLSGPAGTGKSESIMAWCTQNEIPFVCVSHSAGMLVTDYTGTYRPNLAPGSLNLKKVLTTFFEKLYKKTKPEDLTVIDEEAGEVTISLPQFTYVLSAFTLAYKFGGVYIADELNAAPPAVLLFLNGCLQNGFIELPEPIGIIYKHENFRFIGTGNPGYPGTNELSPALKSRLASINVPALTSQEMIDRLSVLNTDFSSIFITKLVEVVDNMNNICKGENSAHQINIRHVNRFLDDFADKAVKDKKQAFFDDFFSETADSDGDIFIDPSSSLYKTFEKYYKELNDLTKTSKDKIGTYDMPEDDPFGFFKENSDGSFGL